MDKAYIVANEQQEREVLEKLEREGLVWISGREATEWIPSQTGFGISQFPYALVDVGYVAWRSIGQLEKYEVVYDGRKEEQMSEKYVVSQEFMNELEEWKKRGNTEVYFVGSYYLSMLPDYVKRWWNYPEINNFECNNRLIAIIRWVNGEDVFEVEKPKKWVVRSKEPQGSVDGKPIYGWFVDEYTVELEATMPPYVDRFNTREEAESWANAHQEVVEIEVEK
ncbi:hypothetical protein G9406_06625 [Weissella paramesenteroides]|uniref:hypothetical protein n=1 Tax=Weissella paramesenteroides TaxID=1249 RepID=UPI002402980D|nr:hypothetical protein [Weissella paramesenteroides]MDF8367250.1 hypothetical protein [Weissella paramesenteroides]